MRAKVPGPKIDVLPLVRDRKASHGPGWCTYTYEHDDAPELELVCGGVNSKTPKAGAVWRQGNLLHFGFEPSPDRMNDAGRALLVNAICYAARFTEDRPIVHTPCGFVGGHWVIDRGVVGRVLAGPGRDLKDLQYYLAKETYAPLANKSREEWAAWYERVRDYLHADAQGRLEVDAEAQKFGVPPSGPDFFARALPALEEPGRSEQARRLLVHYAPDGPGFDAPAEAWRKWSRDNGPYLFFSDTGGYRWYLDPLAKKKGVPTAQLRGPARATLPALERRP